MERSLPASALDARTLGAWQSHGLLVARLAWAAKSQDRRVERTPLRSVLDGRMRSRSAAGEARTLWHQGAHRAKASRVDLVLDTPRGILSKHGARRPRSVVGFLLGRPCPAKLQPKAKIALPAHNSSRIWGCCSVHLGGHARLRGRMIVVPILL